VDILEEEASFHADQAAGHVDVQSSIIVKDLTNGNYITQEPLVFHVNDDDFPGAVIVIPAGFTTDFGSIPQPLRCFVEGIGTDRDLIYLLHDWVYATEYFSWRGVAYKELDQADLDRYECDELLLMGCKGVGDSWLTRNVIWGMVRIFGGFVWRDHTPEGIAANRALFNHGGAK
jgi:hypothetical protein